ncbi:MAG: SGNH/GDSL hydrolase family protein [Victivallaceae bacterium]|nr:SGNH/GDSL hydrolase family protein [Victivallaceae bacterium]
MIHSQWQGKKVGFLGDSITDRCHVGTTRNYWQDLEDSLGLTPLVYGLNGWSWDGVRTQAETMRREHGDDIDAIFIFMGTNDFNSGIPLSEWWSCREEEVISHGIAMKKMRRYAATDGKTFRGRINVAMAYLKETFPLQQIVLLTPIHRGFAEFGGDNIQPEESFPNDIGLFLEVYIDAIKEAGGIWSTPVIDLYSLSGLLPAKDAYTLFFHDAKTDRLHPNASGHERIAKTMMYQMLTLPSTFRSES